MSDIFILLAAAAVVLVVVCLIVREQTDIGIRALHPELMSMRIKEKRLSDKREEIEKIGSEIREAIVRTDRRQYELEQTATRYGRKLGEIHLAVRDEAMPERETEGDTAAQQESSG